MEKDKIVLKKVPLVLRLQTPVFGIKHLQIVQNNV